MATTAARDRIKARVRTMGTALLKAAADDMLARRTAAMAEGDPDWRGYNITWLEMQAELIRRGALPSYDDED